MNASRTAGGAWIPLVLLALALGLAGCGDESPVSPPPLAIENVSTATFSDTPLHVHFDALVTGGVPPYTCTWCYGDGCTDCGTSCSEHTYRGSGTYAATLRVDDAAGHRADRNLTVTVVARPEPAPSPRRF